MSKEIIVGVISSLITAAVMFGAASSLGVFNTKIDETKVLEVANNIVNIEALRELLILKMDQSEKFGGASGDRGERGVTGEQGETGGIGPAWTPSLSFHALSSKSTETKVLGSFKLCALNRSGASHESQACTCTVQIKDNKWNLSISLDDDVDGRCNCGAVCVTP